jgi:uncharacterized protein
MMIQGQAAGHPGRQSRPRVAVIGAGVAGLTAAYLLQRAYDVTLYEAQDRLGGHAHTHDIAAARGSLLALDSGFLVHNTRTYPHLIRLFGELGVATQETEMHVGAVRGLRAGICRLTRPARVVPFGAFGRPAAVPVRTGQRSGLLP